MIDKKVTITEGLLNLAKIQSEMYSVANAKKRSTDAPSGNKQQGNVRDVFHSLSSEC